MHRSCSFRAYHFCFKFASARSSIRSHVRTTRPSSMYPSVICTSVPDNSQAYSPCMSLSAGLSTSLFCSAKATLVAHCKFSEDLTRLALPRRELKDWLARAGVPSGAGRGVSLAVCQGIYHYHYHVMALLCECAWMLLDSTRSVLLPAVARRARALASRRQFLTVASF